MPDKIKRLADIQMPYMFFNEEHDAVELRSDAPKEVIEEREEYLQWWKQHQKE